MADYNNDNATTTTTKTTTITTKTTTTTTTKTTKTTPNQQKPFTHSLPPYRYEDKQKELEAVVNPIMTKLYGGAGGAGGMPEGFEGGMPGGGAPGGGAPGGGAGYGGPTVEEVD